MEIIPEVWVFQIQDQQFAIQYTKSYQIIPKVLGFTLFQFAQLISLYKNHNYCIINLCSYKLKYLVKNNYDASITVLLLAKLFISSFLELISLKKSHNSNNNNKQHTKQP